MKKLKPEKVKKEKVIKDGTTHQSISSPYQLFLKTGEFTYEATGETIEACLKQIKPVVFKAKGIFEVFYDGKKAERVMRPFQIKQLLSRDLNQLLFAKTMRMRMK